MAEIDRRNFLKLVGVSSATATGCYRYSDLPEQLIAYVVQPEEITPGLPVVYASTCQECSASCGLHVRTREGRPIKLEGNPDHPVNRGALCARGQAGILRTYHPDRLRGPAKRSGDGFADVSWSEATAEVGAKVREAGSGTWILSAPTGPTLSGVMDNWLEAVGGGNRVVYQPFAYEAMRSASEAVFGVASQPIFDLSETDLVIDFGADSLESWVSPTEHARQLENARDVGSEEGRKARFVYVGPRLSMTAGNADEWLAAKPGTEGLLALALARIVWEQKGAGEGPAVLDPALLSKILAGADAKSVASKAGISADAIRSLGRALAEAERPVALPPGVGLTSRNATATTAAVLILNAVIGAVGHSLRIPPPDDGQQAASFREVLDFVDAMKAGKVKVLVIHGANPVYSLPPEAGFADALSKVDLVVSTASIPDETSALAHLVLPDHTPLESWGDAAPRPGVRSLVQPTLRPLFDTQAVGDTLLAVGRAAGATLPDGSFRSAVEEAWAGTDWRAALARGGVFSDAPEGGLTAPAAVPDLSFDEPKLDGNGSHILVAHPSPLLGDGSGAPLQWLQETPDPVTKISWQSWAEVSRNTAESLGVTLGEVIKVETPSGSVEVPVLPRGGIRDDVVAIAIGQGHTYGRYASRSKDAGEGPARGVNANALLPATTDEKGGRAWLTSKASLSKTGRFERVALTQKHDNKRERMLGESVALSALAADHGEKKEHGAGHGGGHGEAHEILRPYDPGDDATEESAYRWGLNVDLERCTGCSACIVACSIENNVPVVGEEGVLRSRQMQWIRIERYVGEGNTELRAGRPAYKDLEQLGDTDIRNSPMMCQQCGAAPCESVCPVFATYHNPEGLNGMIYNRCIGTRYCSNNCPYKVRRYNWFDYQIENWPEPLPLMLNPDVTVRGQGVMEKCTFCIQRIQSARQVAKDEGRLIADGEVRTACQQTCPTDAIDFGNLRDEKSEVSEKSDDAVRAYHALHALNTRPGVTYLAKVDRRPEGGKA